MALDYGHLRVGVASTDDSGEFALPRMVLPNDELLLEKVLNFKREEGIERVVMGESRNLDGTANPVLEESRKFKEKLEEKGVEVLFHPEVYTTVEARQLQGQTDMTDASAAALILKSYIDTVYNRGI